MINNSSQLMMTRYLKSAHQTSPTSKGGTGQKSRAVSALQLGTIASQSKVKPEPKFQKVVTSQLLSQMRKDSKLICKNPERFLEDLVHGKSCPQPLNTQSFSSFIGGLGHDNATKGYRDSLVNLENKCRQVRNRALLLTLGSNPAIKKCSSNGSSTNCSGNKRWTDNEDKMSSSTSFSSFLGGQSNPDDVDVASFLHDKEQSIPQEVDIVLQSFLDQIRVSNVDSIVLWVESRATISDFELPFGIPSNKLKMPVQNLEQISNQKCADFIRSGIDEFLLLDAEYHAKLEEITGKAVIDNIRSLEKSNWASKDSALLFHTMNLMQSDSLKGNHFSKEKLSTELALRLFPLYSREDIIEQKYHLKMKRSLEEKRDNVIKDWIRDKDNLVKKMNSAWVDIKKEQTATSEFHQEKKLQQEKCKYWTQLLEKTRQESRKRIRAIETLVEPLEQKALQHQKTQHTVEKVRRHEQKKAVDKFHQLKATALEVRRKHEEDKAKREEQAKRIQAVHNRSRVIVRRQEFHEKVEQAKQLEREKELEKQARQEMLEKTKHKVEIDYCPMNVLNDTHASLVRSHEIQEFLRLQEDDKTVKFFQERYSFSAETLWKDARVRLEAKLRDAGLIDNSYAKGILQAMQPSIKPHLKSQISF